MNEVIENVKEYYGKILHSTADLQSKACCCSPDSMPKEVKKALIFIADEVINRYYGCGSPLPPLLEGMTVLDLGCGSGRDVYVAAQLVGEHGRVIGVDMTQEQLDVAKKYEDEQRQRFGYAKSNVKFLSGYIEDLRAAGISDSSVDIVISNCVVNLSPDKEKVFAEIWRVLKPGGELYFSDVFADRRIPEYLAADPVLRGECIGGALYYEDFRRIMQRVGFTDFRYKSIRNIDLDNEAIIEKVGFANFTERTVRAFKLDDLEDICEDYGQIAVYNGSIASSPHFFDLDDHHRFFTGKPLLVCGNTAAMLAKTRFASAFRVIGNRSTHYGVFGVCGGKSETNCFDTGSSCGC
ncbi:Methyltransferase type 11 [Desulfitobacterium hafniense DCB-2]|uniref:Arsenite methyltransferase n=1 Tax=Desulfitobacterium hafniense (strain DSM 10664 / DCB-2) TaxID=272564 RepID=B8G075_DESHD|nr:methyltransferase domain-containing protein [Desulfitobacterium hafniense]ACL21136.1 Methyltransferase type 11 [Desulfitobacterium hafniense DCB-2]